MFIRPQLKNAWSQFIRLPSSGIRYLLDTDIGGDIDDSLALLLLKRLLLKGHPKPLGITTTHIDPEEKARIAKIILTECGYPEIPVFSGVGSKRTEPNEEFLKQNSLFPSVFGFPNSTKGGKKWYEKQGAAYRDHYPEQFSKMQVEEEPASQFIARTAKQFTPNNKLTIVTIGPLHNIAAALKDNADIADNIRLVAMGGVYPKGYNWLISPETSSIVLSQIETVCVTSEFIIQNNLFLTKEELQEIESSCQSLFGRTFISDWKNWHKGDVLKKEATYLYDPVTLYLALHPEEIVSSVKKRITFPCLDANGVLKPTLRGSWYFKPGLENRLIQAEDHANANVAFIEQVRSPEKIKNEIVIAIKNSLTSFFIEEREELSRLTRKR